MSLMTPSVMMSSTKYFWSAPVLRWNCAAMLLAWPSTWHPQAANKQQQLSGR